MIKINKNLALFTGLLFFLGTLLLVFLEKFSPLITHVTYYCQSLVTTYIVPIPYYLSVIPFVILLFILAASITRFFVINIRMQFLKHTLHGHMSFDKNTSNLLTHLGLKEKVILVSSPKPFAFCLGIFYPNIYVSTKLLNDLTLNELEAVLRHEQYHVENHDTITMIIASVAHSLFPFFPLVSDLIKKYRVEREIAADKYAVKYLGEPLPLISALKKLIAFSTPETVTLAAIADHDTLEPRIHSLLNKPYVQQSFKIKHLLITLFSSFVLAGVLIMPVHAKEIHHEQHDVMMFCTDGSCMNSCLSKNSLDTLYSEIPNKKSMPMDNASHQYSPK